MGFEIIQGDCLEIMPTLGVTFDACITDPPYGTTACAWDSVIPFAPMWANLKRLVKRNGATVLFGSQPFTSALVMSNPQMYRHEWIWIKNRGSNFANTVREPFKEHESVLVFGEGGWTYNQQFQERTGSGGERVEYGVAFRSQSENYRAFEGRDAAMLPKERVPSSWQKFNTDTSGLHPTIKPVELMRYLIRTYTNTGDTVLDFTCGSGSTGVACVIEGRNFIGIEKDVNYCAIAEARIKRASGIACDIPKQIRVDKDLPLFPSALETDAA
jgi:site-specific DNA-methyltransferase (adenine-specific)